MSIDVISAPEGTRNSRSPTLPSAPRWRSRAASSERAAVAVETWPSRCTPNGSSRPAVVGATIGAVGAAVGAWRWTGNADVSVRLPAATPVLASGPPACSRLALSKLI
ncbi:MAG: hypothetical protein IPL61_06970 [Myxococcales bacterium]|nr:hypothetical protein [Myxococcales bacterium]